MKLPLSITALLLVACGPKDTTPEPAAEPAPAVEAEPAGPAEAKAPFFVASSSLEQGALIPPAYAFCIPAEEGHVTLGTNTSPQLSWSGVPDGTQSFAVIAHDPDVPSVGDDVNQEGKTVSADLPRVDFTHWVLVDIPGDVRSLDEGVDSSGVTAGGKESGATDHGVRGLNDYTKWFAGDADMGGEYGGYDGPCPPWNDEILHHYVFTVYALDVTSLALESIGRPFERSDALAAMEGHVLASAELTGTYTLNPALEVVGE